MNGNPNDKHEDSAIVGQRGGVPMEHSKELPAGVEKNNIASSPGVQEKGNLATVAMGYCTVASAWSECLTTGGLAGGFALSADQMVKFAALWQTCLSLELEDVIG